MYSNVRRRKPHVSSLAKQNLTVVLVCSLVSSRSYIWNRNKELHQPSQGDEASSEQTPAHTRGLCRLIWHKTTSAMCRPAGNTVNYSVELFASICQLTVQTDWRRKQVDPTQTKQVAAVMRTEFLLRQMTTDQKMLSWDVEEGVWWTLWTLWKVTERQRVVEAVNASWSRINSEIKQKWFNVAI